MRKILTRLAILLLSVFTVSAGATAATLPLMIKSFPSISGTTVELLMTIPSLGIILFTPLSNIVADYIGVKKTIITGLFLIFIAGIIPAISLNFPLIFASRIVIGLGTGLIASFSQSLIIQMYHDEDQQRMLGLASVFQGLGMFAMTYFAGVLLQNGWQRSYWIYLITIPIMLLGIIYIPKNAGETVESNEHQTVKAKDSKKVDAKVWVLALFALVFNSTFAFISIKFAALVISRHYGTISDASTLLGIMSFAMAAGGFIFIYIQKHWQHYSMAIGLGFAAGAFTLLASSYSLIQSAIGVILVGISVSIFMASMVTSVNILTSPNQVPFSTSIAITFANIGTLIAPYFAQGLSRTFKNETPSFIYSAGAIIFTGLLVLAIIAGLNYEKLRYNNTNKDQPTINIEKQSKEHGRA